MFKKVTLNHVFLCSFSSFKNCKLSDKTFNYKFFSRQIESDDNQIQILKKVFTEKENLQFLTEKLREREQKSRGNKKIDKE